MAKHRSDPALVRACLRGEQAAWDAIVDQYGRLVYSIARRYGLVDADADDVFQNVFLLLHRTLERLRDQTRLSAWLITTTHRECWRVGKKSDRYPELDERIADVGTPDPVDADRWERQHLVREGLDQLGGRCRDLLLALFQGGETPSYDHV
ncbi:MAG: sigma-70 family RNA polymerase sigma factor, partial [Phycisphaerae bacterium]|nr:sigma-70 family RNA polymerase sigma factor [Phycisphaerae bacterium]